MFLWDDDDHDDGTGNDNYLIIINNLPDKLHDSLKMLDLCLGLYSLMHKYMP